ncbi:hypothetical protein [Actinophytocola glycyrrhizae]|uniref:Uncharacterized protein n=1 Tax=Actinophytocola glycyrrhizae TaxID=2044873 RepID=A0ABV9SCX5_9PSEU
MSEDIKDLLGKAIGDEPPMGVDRDEVFRAGRQRVRRRRGLAAGGVVAAVVAAAVGAATLTNFVSVEPEPLPPAAGNSQFAPPGPDLPLPPRSQPKPSVAGAPPLTTGHTGTLTQRLFQSGIVRVRDVLPWPSHTSPTGFRIQDDTYLFEADISTAKAEGFLRVSVSFVAPGSVASCAEVDAGYDSCKMGSKDGLPVAEATWKGQDGERRDLALVAMPDGTKITAMSSNISQRLRDARKVPSGRPVFDAETLTRLIVKSGFSVF